MKSSVILIVCMTALANANKKHEAVMGIDIGTTYSCSVVYNDGRVSVSIIPSYVAFTNGEILKGIAAKNPATIDPENTVFGVKKLIGRDWHDPGLEEDIKVFPFKVFEKNNKPYISVNTGDSDKDFSPEEITAIILKHLKDSAEECIGTNVSAAVITVPTYFKDAQRQATKEAGELAGLNVLSVTNEPNAAAVTYGVDKKKEHTNVLVYHLGGGTFDVTVLTVHHGVIQVVATLRDSHLGGQDLNERTIEYLIEQFKEKGINIIEIEHAVQKLEDNDFLETLTRAKFEEESGLFVMSLLYAQKVLNAAKITAKNIDDIIITGGATRIPYIQEMLMEYFGQSLRTDFKPDEAVAYGAAIQAHMISNEDEMEWNVNPLSFGIETFDGVMLKVIPRFTSIPAKETLVISTFIHNQEIVTIRIYQGERYLAKDNTFLGEFELKGIPTTTGGEPQIEVTFELDVNGVLLVTAEDKGTGVKENTDIIIKDAQIRLRLSEMQELLNDSEKFDDTYKETVVARTTYENYLFSLEKQIKELNMDDYLRAFEQILEIHKAWLRDSYLNASTQDYKAQLRALEIVVQPIITQYQEEYKDEL